VLAVLLPVWLVLAAAAWRDDQAGRRALGFAEPLVDTVCSAGLAVTTACQSRPGTAGLGAAIVLVAMALALRRSRTGAALLALGAGAALVGQGLLLAGHSAAAAIAYAIAFACGIVGGRRPAPREGPELEPVERWEKLALAAVCAGSALIGLYAINRHLDVLMDEMLGNMIMATRCAGLRNYVVGGFFLGNSTGLLDLFVVRAFHAVLGPSLLAIRFTPAIAAAVSLPLLWAAARRLVGPTAAMITVVLVAASPTHLWFGRSDYTNFAFVAIYAACLVLALDHALEGRRPAAWALVAVLMGAGRLLYAAVFTAWLLPVVMVFLAHLGDRRRPRAWAGVLAVAAGAALWAASVTLVHGLASSHWRWISPVHSYGAAAWDAAGSGVLARLRAIVVGAAGNIPDLAAGWLTDTRFQESFWVRWTLEPYGDTWAVGAVAPLLVPALGLLLARIGSRRAAMILVWIGVGLIPGLLAQEMGVRRVLLAVPAAYVAIAWLVAEVWSALRSRAPAPVGGGWLALAVATALAGAVAVGLNGGLRAGMGEPPSVAHGRFVADLATRCDLVVHDFEFHHGHAVEYFALPELLDPDRPAALQYEPRYRWPGPALHPEFRADAGVYGFLGLDREARELAARLDPQRVAFVLREEPDGGRWIELLAELYPTARRTRLELGTPWRSLEAFEVERAELRAVGTPVADGPDPRAARARFAALLPSLVIGPGSVAAAETLRGGLLVERQGWYRFSIEPEGGAELELDGIRVAPGAAVPLLAGVHRLDLELSPRAPGELRLTWGEARTGARPLARRDLVGPRALEAEQARALPLGLYPGYAERRVLVRDLSEVRDIAATGDGGLAVLRQVDGSWEVLELSSDGAVVRRTGVSGPTFPDSSLAVAPDGTIAIAWNEELGLFTPEGERLGTPFAEPLASLSDVAFAADGTLWISLFNSQRLVHVGRDGRVLGEGRVGAVVGSPADIEIDREGRLWVASADGRLACYGPDGPPGLLWSFEMAGHGPPARGRFAVTGRGLIAPVEDPSLWVAYDERGTRLMPARPEHDLMAAEASGVSLLAARGGTVWAYDPTSRTLWRTSELP
jgi:hypothetical protein